MWRSCGSSASTPTGFPLPGRGFSPAARVRSTLLGRGIDPWVTLYHWDLPQELEDAGGWPVRDTAYRFADYAMLVFDALRDRVNSWTTLNEPLCTAMLGYDRGIHAPGRKDFGAALHAVHHLLLGHGLATQRMRAAATRPAEFGITLNTTSVRAASDSPADVDAARRADGLGTRIYLDPLVHGHYPADVLDDLAARGVHLPIEDGDLEVISTPFDVLGINYYFTYMVSGVDGDGRTVDDDGLPVEQVVRFGVPVTAMDWEITPDGLTDLLVRFSRDYPGKPIFITENGAAFDDVADDSGFVRDDDRTAYLSAHIAAVARARQLGADVRGYFAWSFMDNFEWAYGYGKRFGIVRVDYESQRRVPKQSAHWYRDVIRRVRGG
jgi:beta-glucosidase